MLLVLEVTMPDCVISLRPNVLLIISDDLRPAFGAYGYSAAYTPHIDRLLNQSSVFLNAHAQQALCGPSRTSILVSRRPDSLGVYDQHGPYWRMKHNYTTLPQYFKQNGYHTVSLGKIFHPGKPIAMICSHLLVSNLSDST